MHHIQYHFHLTSFQCLSRCTNVGVLAQHITRSTSLRNLKPFEKGRLNISWDQTRMRLNPLIADKQSIWLVYLTYIGIGFGGKQVMNMGWMDDIIIWKKDQHWHVDITIITLKWIVWCEDQACIAQTETQTPPGMSTTKLKLLHSSLWWRPNNAWFEEGVRHRFLENYRPQQ